MQQHFQSGNYQALGMLSAQIANQQPQNAMAWRQLGIATFLCGGDGIPQLQRAASLNDEDASTWLNVIGEFSFHAKGQVERNDVIQQVVMMNMRSSPYMDYPLEVHIETLAICNAKCSFCPYPTMERQGDKMPDALIEKIIGDLKAIPAEQSFVISPFKVNEPFLDKRIFSVCAKINAQLPNAQLRLFTNGSPLTETILDKIAGIRNVIHLWISLNESDAEKYTAVLQLPFAKTIEKLDGLHKRVAAGYPHPVVVSRVTDGTAADEAFRVFVTTRYPLFQCVLLARSNWTGQVDTGMHRRLPPVACSRWYEVSIMASGKVALCCMDGEGKHVIGDVNHQSVLEIYNSPSYRKMRQFTFSRRAAAAPCDTCIY